MKQLNVALVCNTRITDDAFQVEYDPLDTIGKIEYAIRSTGHNFIFIEADETAYNELRECKPDIVFNRAEGMRGESRESHIPAILEMLNIPYVGSNILTTAIALDKGTTKKILSFHGIKNARFQVFEYFNEPFVHELSFPLILKPNHEGSSVGIDTDNVVHYKTDFRKKLTQMLENYKESILAEEFIEGREFSVGILGNRNNLRVLPILEIDFSKLPADVGTVYGQKAKTILDTPLAHICPAKIADSLRKKIEQISIQTFNALNCYDFARIDLRMNASEELFILEVNPLPGLDYNLEENEISFYPVMAFASGMNFDEMIQEILQTAIDRYQLH
ncbi:ATP-grasp domain-containing protein [Candidatus Borrarchaeum sp.]|uniref:D-alanine--D-alanine ligase family protein n=1 Tax=Candidatus Borrarchaeum sp. TaxID=2846742 RepID=UPI00257D6570|nr:ATP-grasp domain-containing protein [Candidatus Borrarchaeum sp.]